jgi:hydrogenase nickel incorporation protein HypB
MCTVCGCAIDPALLGQAEAGDETEHGGVHRHGHAHDHAHHHAHDHDHDHGEAGERMLHAAHAPGVSAERMISIERDILSKNNAYAAANRARLRDAGVFALNLVSSPGSGKTTLLVRTIEALRERLPIAVIEGDQQTSNDAQRIRATGAPALQINTGRGCHLDAHMIAHALDQVPLARGGVLFIENVGNLVCPASFDLGEAHKVAVLSTTEGEDKPLKYPDMFAAADLMLLNKSDLLPHLEFDAAACIVNALRVNPRLQTMTVSARTGEGMQAFHDWIVARACAAAA